MKWSQAALESIHKGLADGRFKDTTPRSAAPVEQLPPDCPEDEFQRRVIQLAEQNGWLAFHPRISIRSRKGYVDLTMARFKDGIGRLLAWELKSAGGKRTNEQKDWAAVLEVIGGNVEYACYRPEDWPTIVEKLK